MLDYTHKVQFATNGRYWNLPTIKINGLVLHSIGCSQPSAQRMANRFNSPDARASVQGFIEPGLFIETAPIFKEPGKAKKCYHVGSGPNGSYNSSRIGIEMCEPSTLKYTGRGAEFKDLDPAKSKDYIRKVTQTAVEVFADLCMFHHLSVDRITTHRQANLDGYGSGHVDPTHIWKLIDYDLNDFRRDVQKAIDSKKGDVLADMTKEELQTIVDNSINAAMKKVQPTVYQTFEDLPDWAKPYVKHAIDAGCIAGTGEKVDGKTVFDFSADLVRTLVVMDRAGVFARAEADKAEDKAEKPRTYHRAKQGD